MKSKKPLGHTQIGIIINGYLEALAQAQTKLANALNLRIVPQDR